MQAWKAFIQTQHGNSVKDFFIKLNHEIAEVKTYSNEQNAVLILNTKKGYWLYKIFEREEKDLVRPIEVYSDRYIKKISDFSFLQNKLIYLVDDTLVHGYNLLETYQQLAKSVNADYICPLVFALNDKIDNEEMSNEYARDNIKTKFWKNLKHFMKMSEEDMGFFCVQETKLLHDENIPYVIDLPYLKMESRQQFETDFEIVLSEEQFHLLQKGNERWKFYNNSYIVEHEEFLNGFIIQMQDEKLLTATRQYILDYVIEGTYRFDHDRNAHIVFVPFAIGKSVSFEALHKLWNGLMDGHHTLQESVFSNECMSENHLKRCYRECIYVLSMIIAERFSEYLESLTNIKLVYDYHILAEHFPSEFIERAKSIEKTLKNNLDGFCDKLWQIYDKNFGAEEQLKNIIVEDEISREAYSDEEAYEVIFVEVLEQRNRFLINAADIKDIPAAKDAALKFEKMENTLDQNFTFQSEEERRYALSKIIVTLVQTSIAGGQLYIDLNRGRVNKAFRYGENSDLALPFFNLEFYWAVILLIEKKGTKDAALEIYNRFVEDLKEQFIELGVFERGFTEKKFDRNKKYYKDILRYDLQLYNKFFFLESFLRGKYKSEKRYMNEIEDFVMNIRY